MPETRKILGQSNPTGGVLTNFYQVPISTQSVVSTISACNAGPSGATFSITVAINGATHSASQFLYNGILLPANDTFASTIGITLNQNDVLRCYTENSNISFQAFGVEIT